MLQNCIFGLQGGWGWGKLTLQAANLAAGWSHHTPHPRTTAAARHHHASAHGRDRRALRAAPRGAAQLQVGFDFFFVFVVGVVPSIWDDYLTRLIFCKQLFSRK